MRIDFNSAAGQELDDTLDWHAARSLLASQRLASAVDLALKRIVDDPERFVRLGKQYRACRVMGYPYQIIFRYEDESDRIYVVAIAHAKRQSDYWKRRR